MKIQLSRVYEINFDGTAAELIEYVDREMRKDGTRLDSLDIGDAVVAATDLYDQGDMTQYIDIVDFVYNYIDCPDSNTLLHYFPNSDNYMPTRPGLYYMPVEHSCSWCLNCGHIARDGVIDHASKCPDHPMAPKEKS